MPITYSINEIDKTIVEVWLGDIAIEDLVGHWKEYLKNRRVLGIRRTLVDLRDAQIRFSARELEGAIQEVVAPVLAGRDWVTALLVKNVDQFRAGTQYQAFAQFYSHDWIFSDAGAATAWLLKQELGVR